MTSLMTPYPVGLSLDIALNSAPMEEILEAYHLTAADYDRIRKIPAFQKELNEHLESLKIEGWSFRKKAQAQAELYLNMVFGMVTDPDTPANIRTDLIKSTVKWAGLEATPKQDELQQRNSINMVQLASDLKNMSDGELEMRVLQVVSKRTTTESVAPDGTTTITTTTTEAAQAAPRRKRTPFGEATVIEHDPS